MSLPDVCSIVTFSHLRWDFVYQRPQHLLSRLATHRRVLFIEEPIHEAAVMPYWERSTPVPGVTVCRLHTPIAAPGFHEAHLSTFVPMLRQLLATEGIDEYVTWLYTPLALPFTAELEPQALIYDCMDELSAFLHAPPALLAQEAALLRQADLVFAGGPSLYRAKQNRNPHVYCFPSSVDTAHFRQVQEGLPEAADQRAFPHPRFGFYGVLDERLDLPLLDALAQAHPEWEIVLVGPVVKIDPATLPRHTNIHYMGQRLYNELPSYIAGWNVCMLPFALNDSTRFISPTKTLEYMAAERPIVSTPITDVVEPYSDSVYIGATPADFIAACERALNAPSSERTSRLHAMRAVLAQTSWDKTAQAMDRLITQAVAADKTLQAA